MATKPTVVKTLSFRNETEQKQYMTKMGAQYRKVDPDTGRPLYKTPANLVFRPMSTTQLEVLTNCVC